MTIQEAVQQLQYAPLAERIQAIELLLHSLKVEIAQSETPKKVHRPFRVRTFDLGVDIQVDREDIYADRVF